MKILLSAYSCEPDSGSESGAGYAILRSASRIGECWAITRSNNVAPIERALEIDPPDHPIHLVALDLSDFALRVKRRFGAVRPYYLLWQRRAARLGAELDREVGGFDVVHHATMSPFWMPMGVTRMQRPLVLGPTSGGTFTPKGLRRFLGARGRISEAIRTANALLWAFLARKTLKRADVVIAQNRQMEEFIRNHLAFSGRLMVQSHACEPSVSMSEREPGRSPIVLFVGRLVTWKGILLALAAFKQSDVPGARLVFVGDGPDRGLLRRQITALDMDASVEIIGPLPRARVLEMMRTASCLLFPSFHDSAGFVVSEALTLGLPVVCLDHGGPGQLVQLWSGTPSAAVRPGMPAKTTAALAAGVRRFLLEPQPLPSEPIVADMTLGPVLTEAYSTAIGNRKR